MTLYSHSDSLHPEIPEHIQVINEDRPTYMIFLLVIPAQYAPIATVPTASNHNTAKLPSMLDAKSAGGAYICTFTSLPKSCNVQRFKLCIPEEEQF